MASNPWRRSGDVGRERRAIGILGADVAFLDYQAMAVGIPGRRVLGF